MPRQAHVLLHLLALATSGLTVACPREQPRTKAALPDAAAPQPPPMDAGALKAAKPVQLPEPAKDGRVFEEDAAAPFTAVTKVPQGATLRGRVSFRGTPPAASALPEVGRTPGDACAKSSGPRLVVDDKGGVEGAVVSLVSPAMGRALDTTRPVPLTVTRCQFHPRVSIAPLAGQLVLKNEDDVLHNAHAYLGARTAFNVGLSRPGVEIPRRLVRAGLLEVRCDAGHPAESAWVVVAKHPYHAVTDAQGRFELRDVPVGEHTIRVWHPGWRIAAQHPEGRHTFEAPRVMRKKVNVTASAAVTVDFELSDD